MPCLKKKTKKLLDFESSMCYHTLEIRLEKYMSYIFFSHDRVKNMRKFSRIHSHSNHELYYLVSGTTKYVVGDEIFNVEEGNVVIVPRGVFHMTDSEACKHNERYLLAFNDAIFDEETDSIREYLLSHKLLHIPGVKREGLEEIMLSIAKHYGAEDTIKRAILKIHVLSLLAYVASNSIEAEIRVKDADKIVHKISEHINAHFGDELDLERLSRLFGISESYLSRKFKSVSGVGLSEYITHVRIMNAERMLRSDNCSITEVAEKCGFNDSNYFSSVFKKIKGVTPLKFSKLVREVH